MIKKVIAVFVSIVLFPVLLYAGSKTIILIIPKLKLQPRFDLVDPETGLEREMIDDEKVELEQYETLEKNYTKLLARTMKWPITGKYQQVISKQGIPLLKKCREYQAYLIPEKRLDVPNIEKALTAERQTFIKLGIEAVLGISDNWQEWLEKNSYERPKVKE